MADWSSIVFDILTATGQNNVNQAVNYIASHIGEEIKENQSKKGRASEMELHQNGRWDMIPVTSRTTRLFLGLRTQCVQCHDHPFNGEWLPVALLGHQCLLPPDRREPTAVDDGGPEEEKGQGLDSSLRDR